MIDLLSQQKFEEALQTTQDVQEKSQQVGPGPRCKIKISWLVGCEENVGNYSRVAYVGIIYFKTDRLVRWVPLKLML